LAEEEKQILKRQSRIKIASAHHRADGRKKQQRNRTTKPFWALAEKMMGVKTASPSPEMASGESYFFPEGEAKRTAKNQEGKSSEKTNWDLWGQHKKKKKKKKKMGVVECGKIGMRGGGGGVETIMCPPGRKRGNHGKRPRGEHVPDSIGVRG